VLSLARFCAAHRRFVLLAWVVVLIGVGVGWQAIGSRYATNFTLGHTDAQKAADLLKSAFPSQAGDSDQIVVHALGDGTVQDQRAEISKMLDRVAALPHVASVVSPFETASGDRISRDGKIAFATVLFDERANVLPVSAIKKVISTAQAASSDKLQVELGGQAIEQVEFAKPASTTAIGLFAAIVVLLISFGSFLAMGLPIVTALFGLGTGIGIVGIASHVIDMPNFSLELAAMIGLGVGIDYALFILTRYREAYNENGGDVHAAVELAMDTAGRAVLFAGATVVIALLGMFALGVSFLYGLAIAASFAVLLVLAASVTLLPALLMFLGHRVGRPGRLARLFSRGSRDRTPRPSFWARWSLTIERRPLVAAAVSGAVMLALAAPVLSLRLGSSDQGNDPSSYTTRRAYDLLAQGFGPGFNGPLVLVTKLPGTGAEAALTRIAAAVGATPDVVSVAPPRISPSGGVATINAYASSSPESAETTSLVKTLRSKVLPPVEQETGATVYVGGATATFIDFSNVLSAKLWLFIGVVIGLSALLLLVVFRSLLIPLQAALMNLLSIGASLGVVVMCFQFGWFPGATSGPVDAFVPVLMFAIVFGLSMDYEVFLVSRIHEEWGRLGDARAAVREGLTQTGRVITAAAAVMVVVFLSFVFGGERVIELFGLGLATAVFLDALVIRCILLPAILDLLGPAAWYFPSWLDRRLPRFAIEHEDPGPGGMPRPALDEA
jgi:putative drug exporter of the RND superfamily